VHIAGYQKGWGKGESWLSPPLVLAFLGMVVMFVAGYQSDFGKGKGKLRFDPYQQVSEPPQRRHYMRSARLPLQRQLSAYFSLCRSTDDGAAIAKQLKELTGLLKA